MIEDVPVLSPGHKHGRNLRLVCCRGHRGHAPWQRPPPHVPCGPQASCTAQVPRSLNKNSKEIPAQTPPGKASPARLLWFDRAGPLTCSCKYLVLTQEEAAGLMCMGIIPCPQSPLGLDAICATLPEVGGETFRFSCVIRNKKQNMGWCLCVSGRLRSVFFKRGLAIPQRFQHAALRRHSPGMCHIPARKGKRRGAQVKGCSLA